MSADNFTGQYISSTFQRLLQLSDNGDYVTDGTGSVVTFLPIDVNNALTASYVAGVTAVTPGGNLWSIQFNSASQFQGSNNFLFNPDTNVLFVTGTLQLKGDQYISGSIYLPDNNHSIYFSGSDAASRLVWNDVDGTLDLGLKGGNVTLQIGQKQVIRIINKTNADLLESEYKAVRIRRSSEGGAQGQRLAVVLAQANNDPNSIDTIGVVTETIANNQEGFITTFGLVRDIDTRGTLQGETWNEGDVLYLSPTTPGQLTNIKPQAPDHTIIVAFVVYKHQNNGKIFVKVDNGYEIDELHNVRINTGSLSSGDLLIYDTNVWYNSKQLSGSYGITGSLNIDGNLFINGVSIGPGGSETDPIFTAKSASFATTGSNHFNGNQVITGSLDVSGSFGLFSYNTDPIDPPSRVGLFYFTDTNFYVSLQ